MNRLLPLLAIFLACSALVSNAYAEVYKKVNPDGSVEFTDIPEKKGAKPIELKPHSTYTPPPPPRNTAAATSKKTAATNYISLSIVSPTDDETIRDGAGNITIKLKSEPGLQSGHIYVLQMDGNKAGEGTSGSFNLKHIDRGDHTFIGQVADENKIVILESQPVTVHLFRAPSTTSDTEGGSSIPIVPKAPSLIPPKN